MPFGYLARLARLLSPGPRALFAVFFSTVVTLLALGVGAPGCASKASSQQGKTCDSAQCATGNACIDDGSGSGPTCHLVCTQQSDCPFNWYCNDGQPQSWCIQTTTAYEQGDGQWGTPCAPENGESNNKACDTGDGFACYGASPTDANAFCTVYDCHADSDCPGGWWCATVDNAPNVTTATRSFGQTHTACRAAAILRRVQDGSRLRACL